MSVTAAVNNPAFTGSFLAESEWQNGRRTNTEGFVGARADLNWSKSTLKKHVIGSCW